MATGNLMAKDYSSYVKQIDGIAGGGAKDSLSSNIDEKKIDEIAASLKDYSNKYNICSEENLAHTWYLNNKIDGFNDDTRKKLNGIFEDQKLTEDQKINDAYGALKNDPKWKNMSTGVESDREEITKNFESKTNAVVSKCAQLTDTNDKPCTPPQPTKECDKPEFFALYCHFKNMADRLGTDVDFIMAQAAEESGWGKDPRAAKNNLFGQNKPKNQWKRDPTTGKYYDTNVEYSSYDECCEAWIKKWGKHVQGAKTHDQYIDGLLDAGYNPNREKYKETMKNLYKSVVARKKKCGVTE